MNSVMLEKKKKKRTENHSTLQIRYLILKNQRSGSHTWNISCHLEEQVRECVGQGQVKMSQRCLDHFLSCLFLELTFV